MARGGPWAKAHGDVFLFFDGHCNPERGAIRRLITDVEETQGEAIITPKIPALDVARWRSRLQVIGYRLQGRGRAVRRIGPSGLSL